MLVAEANGAFDLPRTILTGVYGTTGIVVAEAGLQVGGVADVGLRGGRKAAEDVDGVEREFIGHSLNCSDLRFVLVLSTRC